MTPGQAPHEETLRPEPAIMGRLESVTNHLRYAPLRIRGYAVDDAATGKRLAGPFMTESRAKRELKALRKQHPAAFVQDGVS